MKSAPKSARRFAIGAEVGESGTLFRVWAPDRRRVSVVDCSLANGPEYLLSSEEHGYHSGTVSEMRAGARYSFRLDQEPKLYPDPASRFQPEGPHGPSQVVECATFAWQDQGFAEADDARVLYELHIGTFTKEGTYRAAAAQFAELAALGITTIELMPINGFPGRFGWGYDGVNPWAPAHIYGSPDDLRVLVATAHAHGLGVILDVVYNHFGPNGNYFSMFARRYFSEEYENDWGDPINFDGPGSTAVREFFCENARYWIEEFHFDGLRLDATQAIFDKSEPHVLADIVRATRRGGEALGKRVYIVAENEPQETKLARPADVGGYGIDALWNDDFHHSAMVALTGRHEAYYNDYRGTPQEFISGLKWGYLFQGQHYYWQKNTRGTPALDLDAKHFITYLQNHDQIANSVTGARLDQLTSLAELRAVTSLMLLSPPTPMLFQGQEFASSAPFFFFADHEGELRASADKDRRKFLEQFPSAAARQAQEQMARPAEPSTFERCKLDFSERQTHAPMYALHRDLLRLRREEPALKQRRTDRMHGSVLAERVLALRFLCDDGDRLLVMNLGGDLELLPIAEPLVAPPAHVVWQTLFCSEDVKYGGSGFGSPWSAGKFMLPARSTLLFTVKDAPKRGPSREEEEPSA
jgi:maltooligosyltrehalose trehalohydrolase